MSNKKKYYFIYPFNVVLTLFEIVAFYVLFFLNKILDISCFIILGIVFLPLEIFYFVLKTLFYFFSCICSLVFTILGSEIQDNYYDNSLFFLSFLHEPVYNNRKCFQILGYVVFYFVAGIVDKLFYALSFLLEFVLLTLMRVILFIIDYITLPLRSFLAFFSVILNFNADDELSNNINSFFDVENNIFLDEDCIFYEYPSKDKNYFDYFYRVNP